MLRQDKTASSGVSNISIRQSKCCGNFLLDVDIMYSSCCASGGRCFRVVRIDEVPTAVFGTGGQMPQMVAQTVQESTNSKVWSAARISW
jgi:hypothetical protein